MNHEADQIKSLEMALNNELKEKEFYLKHAERTSHPLGKAMFQAIASDEAEHYERILQLYQQLKEKGQWAETIPLTVKGTEVKSILEKVVNSITDSPKADIDDVKAVEIAIEFEKKGEQFYKQMHDAVKSPSEKAFFKMLMTIEREHRLSLEDTAAYFNNPEEWFRMKEKGRLDGA